MILNGYQDVHTIEKNIHLNWFLEGKFYNIFLDKIRISPGFINKSMNLQSSIEMFRNTRKEPYCLNSVNF